NMSKNNLKKYLVIFVRNGFLVFDEVDKTYSLGPKLISLGLKALNQLDLFAFIDSYIFKIKDLLNKPVALAVWADNRPVITRFQKSNNPIDINMEIRSEEHTSELQSRFDLVCRILLEKKKKKHRD